MLARRGLPQVFARGEGCVYVLALLKSASLFYLTLLLAIISGHVLCGYFFPLGAASAAQAPELKKRDFQGAGRDYIFQRRMIEDGLPHNSVLCLWQGKSGYLWLGTRSGLARFDGTSFRAYTRWNTPELPDDYIHALYEDDSGVLWVGTGGGLARLEGGKWRGYGKEQGLTDVTVRAISGDASGVLWIGAANGLHRFVNDRIEPLNADSWENFWGNSIARAIPGSSGGLWIGDDADGVYRLEGTEYSPLRIIPPLVSSQVTALLESQEGLWTGTSEGLALLRKKDNGDYYPEPVAGIPEGHAVRALLRDRGGSLWAGADGGGLFRREENQKTFSPVNLPFSLENEFIYALLQDREGTIWIGTSGNGLLQAVPVRVASIPGPGEAGIPRIRCLASHPGGAVWAGLEGHGLARFVPGAASGTWRMEPVPGSGFLAGKSVSAIYFDAGDAVWIGLEREGLVFLNAALTATWFTNIDGLSSNAITAIVRDGKNRLWVGSAAGLNRLEGDKFIACENEGDTAPYINAIYESSSASGLKGAPALLIASRQGLLRVKDNALIPFAPAGARTITGAVSAVWEDRDHVLWIGSEGGGLFRLYNGQTLRLTTDSGLPDNYILSILDDSRGYLWIGSRNGIFRLDKKQPEQWVRGEIPALTPLSLDEADGMNSRECVAGGNSAAAAGRDGKLWFPTVKGLVAANPAAMLVNAVPPSVWVEKAIIDGREVSGAVVSGFTLPVFPSSVRVVEFHFTAISLWNPDKLRIFHMLEGFGESWRETPPRQKRAAIYSGLAPGSYRFRVRARNNDGVWSQKEAIFSFEIKGGVDYFVLAISAVILAVLGFSGAFLFLRRRRRADAPAAPEEGVSRERQERGEKKYQTSGLSPETSDETLLRLLAVMEKEKIYLRGDLSLKMLAQRLNVHYNHLSQIVNGRLGMNFNDYINKYRIEEAMRRLKDPAQSGRSILEIAYETGFYSKSVFNTAFKKFSGMTPSQFRKSEDAGDSVESGATGSAGES